MLFPGLISAFTWPTPGKRAPSCKSPESRLISVIGADPAHGTVVVPAGHTMYCVVPVGCFRLRSK